MKKKTLVLSGIMSFALLLGSCNKEEIEVPSNDEAPTRSGFVNPMEEEGIVHNSDLQYILENITETPPYGEMAQRELVMDILNVEYGGAVTLATLPEYGTTFEAINLSEWLSLAPVSTELQDQVMITVDELAASPDLSSFIDAVNTREMEAEGLFSGDELNIYYAHFAVARASATFWAPIAEGGLNGYSYVGTDLGLDVAAIDWDKVVACDLIGAVFGGPGGAATASAISVVMQS
ncbi:MAG: hypothetical protein GQ574_07800 [Crocinitomix sp.]|nr:hypothetical protein [Crocinitomix sp.]